ncbi:MAG: winged helix-turn-helix transcriptional regulator [Planctomycetes bacterium]|nr:winged helix-turn-helix transcriptional regulator [Planctomycetota bacterium]
MPPPWRAACRGSVGRRSLAKRARVQSESAAGQGGRRPAWTFLSNHAHVLLLLAKDPEIRLREVAERVGITERAVQRIVADLELDRYIERERLGRRNRYRVHRDLPLRHPVEAHRKIASLIALVVEG